MPETKKTDDKPVEEIWKDIEGYEGLYQVSNMGNVRSLNYSDMRKTQILRPWVTAGGYLRVSLYKGGKRHHHTVHRLVAAAFLPNPDRLPEVNHIDENKTNNRVENLEWCDHTHNSNHGTRNERIARTELNDPTKSKCVRCVETGEVYPSAAEVGRKTGIYFRNITTVCHGKRQTAGGFHWEFVTNSAEKS